MLKKYLDNNLIKEFIRFNLFLAVFLGLFIYKLNKEFRLYVNYRAFNVIIIKIRYLLSLI